MCLKEGWTRNKKGFLLVEALLSVVILSVSLTLIIRSMMASLRALSMSAHYTTVLMLADNKMSELMQDSGIEGGLEEEKHFPAPYDRYSYILSTETETDDTSEGINQVSLTVQWPTGTKKKKIDVVTYLFDSGQ